ncbi:MAG: hypothetical protein L3J05_08945, partial [Robiginitomaculum sp.]|nr:hypothetical protein [Robiginitomaculum sp.]
MAKNFIVSVLSLTGLCICAAMPSFAQTVPSTLNNAKKQSIARIVEDVPGPNERVTNNLIRVKAINTPSGFRVPRYVSLKYSTSNGRPGP